MMRAVCVAAGGSVGLIGGCVLGFALAMLVMSLMTAPNDGTAGMREVLVCVPGGGLLGLLAGIGWGWTTGLAT